MKSSQFDHAACATEAVSRQLKLTVAQFDARNVGAFDVSVDVAERISRNQDLAQVLYSIRQQTSVAMTIQLVKLPRYSAEVVFTDATSELSQTTAVDASSSSYESAKVAAVARPCS